MALFCIFRKGVYRLAAIFAPRAVLFSTRWLLTARELPPVSSHTRTTDHRLAAMRALIERSWAMLQRNPEGLAHFRSRNYKARALPASVGQTAHDA